MRVSAVFLVFILTFSAHAITFTESMTVSPGAGSIGWSSPAVGDLDNDGVIDAVVGTSSGKVTAVSSDGRSLWTTELPEARCAKTSSSDRLYSTPAIGSLWGDGTQQVVVGLGGFRGEECDGGIVALDGVDGKVRWFFSLKKWAKKNKVWSFRNAVIASPALADTDGDGRLEIAFGSFNRHLFLLNADGSVRWVYQAADTIWSSPAFLQADDDQRLEIVSGTDISGNSRIKPITQNGGYVLVFDSKPVKSIVAFRDPSRKILQSIQFVEQVVYSSPVVGDVDAASVGDEVVVGSGCFFPQGSRNKEGKWFQVINPRTGEILHTLPAASCSMSSAAIGDVNNDGVKDIITGVSGSPSVGGDGSPQGSVFTILSGQPSTIWQRGIKSPQTFQSPSILEGEKPAVIFTATGQLLVVDGMTGETVQELNTGLSSLNNPAFVDINHDRIPDAVVAGNTKRGGTIRFFVGASSTSFSAPRQRNWRF